MAFKSAMNRVEIAYCPKCRWLLRAAWVAPELLATFEEELQEGTPKKAPPRSRPQEGSPKKAAPRRHPRKEDKGVFRILLNGEVVADRKRDAGFPELPELKQRIRDRIAPGRDLGHIDRRG